MLLLLAPVRSLDNQNESSLLHVKSIGRQFAMGFMSAILNPKNAIFYLSLFTVMVSSETSLGIRGLYALWMTGIVLFWDVGIAGLVGNQRIKSLLNRWIFGIEKLSGLMLAFFGVLLTFQ